MELAIPGKVESKFHRAYSGQFFGFFGLTSIQISNKKKHGLDIGDFMLIKIKNSFIYLLLKRYIGLMYKKTKKNFKK